MDEHCRPDRTEELRLAKARRRVEQFDAVQVVTLCGCGFCHLCCFIAIDPPAVESMRAAMRFGGNTPDGE